jgi:hypothetical protein
VPRLEVLEDRTLPSTLTVLNTLDKGAGSLRDAITRAKNGDTIVFAPSLNGQTITLISDQLTINKNLDIEGPGASLLAISGNDANRIFDINGGYTVTINGLTLTHGLGKGDQQGANSGAAGGGAILNGGSTVNLANDLFSNNQAPNIGGAITNGPASVMTVTNSSFLANRAVGQVGARFVEAGAIWNSDNAFDSQVGASLTVIGCTFIGNQAIGANGGKIDNGVPFLSEINGGAIHTEGNDLLTVKSSVFIGNQAIAGNGGSANNVPGVFFVDWAIGGAITTDDSTLPLTIDGCTFKYNQAIGGSYASGSSTGAGGGLGNASGGALFIEGPVTVSNCNFVSNQALGGSYNVGGSGAFQVGTGNGGAIADVPFANQYTTNIINCTFTNNHAEGGAGNVGGVYTTGAGIGGAFATSLLPKFGGATTAMITGSTFTGNQAIGGQGGSGDNGGLGLGGAIANVLGLTVTVSNCTLTGNSAIGGAGGAGANGGNGQGGGIFNDGPSVLPVNTGTPSTLTVTGSTISSNQATGGAAGSGGSVGQGMGGGAYFASGGIVCLDMFSLLNISGNAASTSNNDVFDVFSIC